MELSGGAKIFMVPESKGKFFDDHMILEKGEARLDKAPGFHLEALGLTIQPDMGNSSARVTLTGGERVDVLALAGSFHVLNSRGLLVANLAPGRALQLKPYSSNGPSRLSGCLVKKGGHFVLTDETTDVIVELTGPGLEKEAGNRIEIFGNLDPAAQPTSDASQVIRVTSVAHRGTGCVGDAAAPAGAGGSPGTGRGSAGGSGTAKRRRGGEDMRYRWRPSRLSAALPQRRRSAAWSRPKPRAKVAPAPRSAVNHVNLHPRPGARLFRFRHHHDGPASFRQNGRCSRR